MSLLVAGVDPGSIECGLAVLRVDKDWRPRCTYQAVLRPPAEEFSARVRWLYLTLVRDLEKLGVQVVGVEEQFIGKGPMTGIKIGLTRGAALCAAYHLDLTVRGYAPATVKKVVAGRGDAEKEQVRRAVARVPGVSLMDLNATDAVAVALCAMEEARRAVQ